MFINHKPAHIKLVWERQLCFQVNKEVPHPLTSFLIWGKEGLSLDMQTIEAIGEATISKHSPIRNTSPETPIIQWMSCLPEEPRLKNRDLIKEAQKICPGVSNNKVLQLKKLYCPHSWQGGGAPRKN